MTDPKQHSLIEDTQGILYGSGMAAVGIVILTHLGLVTGQTAGLAILISYMTGWSFGAVFQYFQSFQYKSFHAESVRLADEAFQW